MSHLLGSLSQGSSATTGFGISGVEKRSKPDRIFCRCVSVGRAAGEEDALGETCPHHGRSEPWERPCVVTEAPWGLDEVGASVLHLSTSGVSPITTAFRHDLLTDWAKNFKISLFPKSEERL